ncbi:MAG: anhydro-N-acetylmuramic acid kinase [Halieaceae bacterium]|jgi:anhydro-N-acetylmuramic acid kinase
MPPGHFIGIMSGTSLDGIDAVLAAIDAQGLTIQATHSSAFDPALRKRLYALARGTDDSIHSLGQLDRALGFAFAGAALALLDKAGYPAAQVAAIGCHGQTIRHFPGELAETRYTLQIGDPSTIAELTGITTIADFRRRDIAAGGEGAPLVPLYHAEAFGSESEDRAVVNIGGIANATLLHGRDVVAGFDCGPGNTLLDAWVQKHRHEPYDAHGAWAAEHPVNQALLGRLLSDPFFQRLGPRSTGPELFNLAWLQQHLEESLDPGTVQATLSELSARAIADSILGGAYGPAALYVCGGGARNTDLLRRLHGLLLGHGVRLGVTDELGVAAEWVEAGAFAWLASRTLQSLPGNSPQVTGAKGSRVLGGIYPAGSG